MKRIPLPRYRNLLSWNPWSTLPKLYIIQFGSIYKPPSFVPSPCHWDLPQLYNLQPKIWPPISHPSPQTTPNAQAQLVAKTMSLVQRTASGVEENCLVQLEQHKNWSALLNPGNSIRMFISNISKGIPRYILTTASTRSE